MDHWAWIIPLLSTLLGAAVAGGIAHLNARHLAQRQERRELEREARHEGERRLALAHAVVFKAQRAIDLITQVTRHVIQARIIAGQNGWPLWQAMQEYLGTDQMQIAFAANELALFAVSGHADYTNELQDLASGHNLLVGLVHAYNLHRDEFGILTATKGTVSVAGETTSFESSDAAVRLRAMRLQQLAELIANLCDAASIHALSMSESVTTVLSELLKDARFKMRLSPPGSAAPSSAEEDPRSENG